MRLFKCILMFCLVATSAAQDPATSVTTSSTAGTVSGTTSSTAGTVSGTTSSTAGTVSGTTSSTASTVSGTTSSTTGTVSGTTSGTAGTVSGTTSGTASTVSGTTSGTASTVSGTTSGTAGTVSGTTSGTTSTVSGTTATVSGTTDTSGTPGTTVSKPTTTIATTTKGPCTPNPCIGNGICEERNGGNFFCICRFGLMYDTTAGCIQAKVFPGDLILNRTFEEDMSDKTSELFTTTAENIQSQLHAALKNTAGYLSSVVLSLKKGSIVAEVQNFYEVSSDATTASVVKAIEAGNIPNAVFEKKSVCDTEFCDETTTSCEGDGIAVCSCREGYIKSQYTTQSCISCPYGEKNDGSEHCKKCEFGFSGFNCNDPNLLVVVVVSCVLGSLLIIFVVALIVVSSRKRKVNTSESKKEFSNVEMSKPVGVPRIPRVNPTSGWQPANLEVTNSGSTEALVIKSQRDNKARYTTYDGDSDDGYRTQDPPVYGGVRSVENGVRGNQNPYYRQDEDRIRRY